MATFAILPGRVEAFQQRLVAVVRDHIIDPDLLAELGDEAGAEALRSRIPAESNVRTGDLGEILATEYVKVALGATVVQRLREKSNVNMPMHGIDCVGVRLVDGRPQFFKGEAKMRAYLRKDTLNDARATVEADDGRIPPEELVLLADRHRRAGNGELVRAVAAELVTVGTGPVRHVVFVGFDRSVDGCVNLFLADLNTRHRTHVATIRIEEFQAFIDAVYAMASG